MKTYTHENGREFRLAGLETRFEVDYIKIYWLDTKKYEEFLYKEIEPFLDKTPQEIARLEKEAAKDIVEEGIIVKPTKKAIKNDSKLQHKLL